jgi:hypothetical protein
MSHRTYRVIHGIDPNTKGCSGGWSGEYNCIIDAEKVADKLEERGVKDVWIKITKTDEQSN